MKQLEGRVALVTGGARGQGAAEAALLAAAGARVVIADVLDQEGRWTAEAVPGSTYAHLDVSSETEWKLILQSVIAPLGRLDILVNNAAIAQFGTIEDTSLQEFQKVHSVNVAGVFLGMKSALPYMKEHGGS